MNKSLVSYFTFYNKNWIRVIFFFIAQCVYFFFFSYQNKTVKPSSWGGYVVVSSMIWGGEGGRGVR